MKREQRNLVYRMIIRARRNSRINANTKNGQSRIKAIARRRKPANGNHRDITFDSDKQCNCVDISL
jgi:hypothetical protein